MKNSTIRIKTIVEEISHKRIADIGCDHGYTCIFACLYGKVNFAIASDIKSDPLEIAKKNIYNYNLQQKINTRLGYGLHKIKPKEVDCLIITGVGGDTIINILKQGDEVIKHMSQLILSPQSNVAKVRKFVHSLDFIILEEKFIKESDKYYNIINCQRGYELPYSEKEYFLGKILIQKSDKLFLNYVSEKLQYLNAIKKKLSPQENSDINNKIEMYTLSLGE